MASENHTPDVVLIWSFIKWFAGGVMSIFALASITAFGATYRQHKELYKWYTTTIDPEKMQLKADVEREKLESQEKYHKDLSDLKHQFAQIQTQVAPILNRMANEEHSILEVLQKMSVRLDNIESK